MTLYAAEQRSERSEATATVVLAEKSWWPWAWMAVALPFLLGSGLVRSWQDRRFENIEVQAVTKMFPLKEIPSRLGDWEAQEGAEAALDPRVARIAGSTDSLIRNYVDKETGVVVTVLILYGRADQVVAHTPEVCYPSVGYQLDENITDEIVTIGGMPSMFRSTVYARKGAVTERQEVYHTFRHNGVWSPEIAGNWRKLRNSPAVFKIQVQRRTGELERRHLNNPTRDFLASLIPQLEQRIRISEGTVAPPETESEAKPGAPEAASAEAKGEAAKPPASKTPE
jgi:hypothetical protein